MLQGHGGQFVAWVRRNVWILLFADLVLVGVAWRQRSWLGAVMAIVLTVVLLGAPPAGSVGRWLRRYRWLVGAFIFGAVNTVYGIWFTYDQSTATEWLPVD